MMRACLEKMSYTTCITFASLQLFEDELESTELSNEEKVPMNFREPTGLWTSEELKDFHSSTV